jgi:hypothetical protein
MYDGMCHDINNNPECNFDGFDCCSEDSCKVPNSCDINLLQNGHCDVSLNTTECFYDLGKCCEDCFESGGN